MQATELERLPIGSYAFMSKGESTAQCCFGRNDSKSKVLNEVAYHAKNRYVSRQQLEIERRGDIKKFYIRSLVPDLSYIKPRDIDILPFNEGSSFYMGEKMGEHRAYICSEYEDESYSLCTELTI